MAYNPSLYNPYGQAQPYTMYQPIPSMTTPQAAAQPVNGLVSVTGIEGAKAYQLPPNSAIALFDADSDVFYLKTTDAAGYPTIKAFSFKPMEHAAMEQPSYVTREDFDMLLSRVEAVEEAAKQKAATRNAK